MDEEQAEIFALSIASGMQLGQNVRIQGIRPELLLALMIVSNLCNARASTVVITAVLNGMHMRNSLHYTGAAVDLVLGLGVNQALWVAELRKRLSLIYDVIDEEDHIHIEYQPHVGAAT